MGLETYRCDVCDSVEDDDPMFIVKKWSGAKWLVCSNECLRRLDPVLERVKEEKKVRP